MAAFERFAFGSIALVGCLFLAACDSAREAVGLAKQSPDEFSVVTRAPLSQPPDFDLRPPRAGAQGLAQPGSPISARTLIDSGKPAPAIPETVAPSNGEAALLDQAGAASNDPDIRRIVDQDVSELNGQDRSIGDLLVFWRSEKPRGQALDPAAEAERLRTEAGQEGKTLSVTGPAGKSASDSAN